MAYQRLIKSIWILTIIVLYFLVWNMILPRKYSVEKIHTEKLSPSEVQSKLKNKNTDIFLKTYYLEYIDIQERERSFIPFRTYLLKQYTSDNRYYSITRN